MNMPKWIREFDCFTKIKNCIVMEGNIYDEYPVLDEKKEKCVNFLKLDNYIHKILTENGYNVCFYDPINGFYNRNKQKSVVSVFAQMMSEFEENQSLLSNQDKDCLRDYQEVKETENDIRIDGQIGYSINCDTLKASEYIKKILIENMMPSVICVNFASQTLADPVRMQDAERAIFMNLLYASMNARRNVEKVEGTEKRIKRQNILIMIVDKVNDIPVWFYLDNPNVKNIVLPTPDKHIRMEYVNLYRDFFEERNQVLTEDEKEKMLNHFIDITDGMKILDLRGIMELKMLQPESEKSLLEVTSLYKYGIKENPWDAIEREQIENAEYEIKKRVKGQDLAVEKSISMIKRAKTGLSGLQHSSNSKPKGILFFAGPTGTGKTELAKALAQLLFGDESACRRFDMSEYAESHSAQKLFGAPPGYVGYEAGGQLTNTIKEHPFSLLLFDEIEKASPSIWDKFLQILEDGRMTDGQGNTVYFSEAIIVFTSNLGIYKDVGGVKTQVVKIDMSFEEVERTVTEGIQDYFHQKGKPEVLNRIGKNLIVFNFIQPDAAEEIMKSQISKICETIEETQGIKIKLDESVWGIIAEKVLGNLEEGGRGVGNVVEEYFITPLSNYVFDNNLKKGSEIYITDIVETNGMAKLICR